MASFVYPPVVPPGQAPPFAVLTKADHRAWIYVSAALGMSMTILASAIRTFIRCGTKTVWGLDDLTLGISTVLSFLQSSLILAATNNGLGSSELLITGPRMRSTEKLYYASNLIYVLSLGCSRVTMILFLRRLTPVRIHVRILTALFAAEAAWTVAVFLVIALQCGIARPWALGRTCGIGWFIKWEAAEAVGATIELAIFALAVWTLTWRVKMPNGKKSVVICSFGLRLALLIAVIAARLTSFDKRGFVTDPTLHEAVFVCWTQAEMNLSIIAATIPIAHKFLSSLVTNYGGAGGRNMSESTYRTSPSHTGDATRMASIESVMTATRWTNRSDNSKSDKDSSEMDMHGGDGHRYSYGIDGNRNRSIPTQDEITSIADAANLTRKMKIRKDISYKVEVGT